jgi:hypothetical protein
MSREKVKPFYQPRGSHRREHTTVGEKADLAWYRQELVPRVTTLETYICQVSHCAA